MRPVLRPNLTARLSRPGVRFRRLPLSSWIALGVLIVLGLVAVLGTVVATHNPDLLSTDTGGPSAAHWFGTDQSGRDIFSRLVAGTRWSLAIGLGATLLALVAGVVVGSFAATSGRRADGLVMRVLDVLMAFPGIALAAVLVAVFGRGILVLILAIGFLNMAPVARVVRANVLAQYGEDYVAAERVIGAKRLFILARHVAVNCAAPILVYCTVTVADAIVFEASLSFIGAGIQPPDPSWGSVLSDGKDLVLTGGWWATLFPGLLILATVLALNILSEGISDAWAAPSARTAKAAEAAQQIELAPETVPAVLPLRGLREAGQRLAAKARDLSGRETVLAVENLAISFPDRHSGVNVVDGVSFSVRSGEVLGLIGESGCGKSLTALSIMGLQPDAARLSGEIRFAGDDLLTMKPNVRRRHLGHDLAMVYQDALSSLNPAMTIRAQLKQFTRRGGTRTPEELLELVNLDPGRTLRAYPHELSGGQRQRVLIAMALSRSPKLIVADEPTTALDVTVQAQIMALLLRLQEELGFALVLVSHDLALVSDIADRVVVMYGGQVAETGATAAVVGAPRHHYTRGLLSAVLSLEENEAKLTQIKGVVPAPADFPPGCRFASRCPAARGHCFEVAPEPSGNGHLVACHYPAESPVVALAEGAQA
ncbi:MULTISPECIES: dipeptide/oligopeptide/nickel ABC transporter permease/ATP-binding protein [Amycolatopsis]|uniref:dipeptide/oligopeptide/nickel ABC transporter permease/ATP-binding protein n=1 Tax=Amycolatopsis TaxID=1813 RepID=UPI00106FD463|nr:MULTISPECIES: dipeptide/oligopeptide/nickel ABC transporter permease/ATP-binding protein [Amycolatopsis]MCG3755573.1 dipeptide/oligopeptide/nickel ABC transporter permease/ATP-binding protein [Amycolatopsis sp. Poz14]